MKTTAYTVEISQVAEPETVVGVRAFSRMGKAQVAANAAASNGAIARIMRATVEGKPAEILVKGLSGELDDLCQFTPVYTYKPGQKFDSLFPGAGDGYLVEIERHEEAETDE